MLYACRFGEMCVHVCLRMVPAEVRARVRVHARVCMNACRLQKYRESTRLLSIYIHVT